MCGGTVAGLLRCHLGDKKKASCNLCSDSVALYEWCI